MHSQFSVGFAELDIAEWIQMHLNTSKPALKQKHLNAGKAMWEP